MYRLMVVDDEALIRQGLLARLDFLGFSFEQVLEAGGGMEALKILEEQPVDICIVDIQMPDLDGLTFIERAKECGGVETQFILLSGYAEFPYAERAISLGVSDYLLKPLANEELLRAVNKVLGRLEEAARRRALDSSRERLARTQQDFWLEREINSLLNEKSPWENRNRYPQIQERYPQLLCAGEQTLILGILNIEADSYRQSGFERGCGAASFFGAERISGAGVLRGKAHSGQSDQYGADVFDLHRPGAHGPAGGGGTYFRQNLYAV